MTDRLGTLATLFGAAVLTMGGCDDDPESDTASGKISSTGAAEGSSSSSSGDLEGSSTGAEGSTSSSSQGGETSAGSGASASDTDGPGDAYDCEILGGVLITEFQAEFPVFEVDGEDVVTAPLGTICMLPTDTSWALRLQFGPIDGVDWTNLIWVRVAEAGTYDLASDFGEAGSGVREPNALSYSLQEGASASSFDTSNQAADGTLQVDDWPAVSGDEISVRGDGTIAGVDGWRFQFSISAVLP